ncbi:hypothetical protein RC54_05115 [Herbaspirillum rubrisubalbicans]|uniref:Uncharacterized protein n=1 Tax=Herbaspirillum rubrisubalbicans TaxID=80842 RepID=A0AAD0U6M8_9BURK|nr:hypothetical protein RC54_05115 [Herbaspirillum rubrisubalbicans]
MWDRFRHILARVTGDHGSSAQGAAGEMHGMGPRELNDLGIGASQIPFVLNGDSQDARGIGSRFPVQDAHSPE